LHVVLVTGLDVLVIKDATELPDSVPCVIGFNVINNVVVGYNFFSVVVDKTLELDVFRLLLKLVF